MTKTILPPPFAIDPKPPEFPVRWFVFALFLGVLFLCVTNCTQADMVPAKDWTTINDLTRECAGRVLIECERDDEGMPVTDCPAVKDCTDKLRELEAAP